MKRNFLQSLPAILVALGFLAYYIYQRDVVGIIIMGSVTAIQIIIPIVFTLIKNKKENGKVTKEGWL